MHGGTAASLTGDDCLLEERETGPDGVERVVIATDGSGMHPTDPRLRRCGWSVYYGPRHGRNHFAALHGPVQCVPRAELRAVARVARTEPRDCVLLVDCDFVVDGTQAMLCGLPTAHLDHQDLWEELAAALRQRPEHSLQIRKIPAHTTEEEIGRTISARDRRMNDAADGLAKAGAWDEHKVPADIVMRARSRKIHTLLIQAMLVAVWTARLPFMKARLANLTQAWRNELGENPRRIEQDELPARPPLPRPLGYPGTHAGEA